jgi:hypothetical protein
MFELALLALVWFPFGIASSGFINSHLNDLKQTGLSSLFFAVFWSLLTGPFGLALVYFTGITQHGWSLKME